MTLQTVGRPAYEGPPETPSFPPRASFQRWSEEEQLAAAELMRAAILRLERWRVEQDLSALRPMGKAVTAVYLRSALWTTPAARQLYLDTARMRQRIYLNEPAES